MSRDVDDLISELFPHHAPRVSASADGGAKASESDWDSPVRGGAQQQRAPPPAAAAAPHADARQNTSPTRTNAPPSANTVSNGGQRSHFDDSDEEPDCDGAPRLSPVPGAAVLHTVPFPSYGNTPGLMGPCHEVCKLTNVGSTSLAHPTVEELQHLDKGITHQTARHVVMCRKGAFHAVSAKAGCGAMDPPGCAFIGCKMCDHPVIRLQGARWQDDNGTADLYLVLRNYYPDWHRLATAYPTVHQEGGEAACASTVLVADPRCAAYCCQCSWYTVSEESEALTTSPLDVASANAAGPRSDGVPRYLTTRPTASGDTLNRRQPLWACKGHVPA